MVYATVNDVAEALGRPLSALSTEESAQIARWITRVEGRIAGRIPSLSTLAAAPAYADTLNGVIVDVVVRRVLNPDGKVSERIDDYDYRRNEAMGDADLWPTASEWAELMPASGSSAFSTRPGFEPDPGSVVPGVWS